MMDTLYLADSSYVEQSYTAKSAYVLNVEERPAATLLSAYDKTRALTMARASQQVSKDPLVIVETGRNGYELLSLGERWMASPTTLRTSLDWGHLQKYLAPDDILQYAAVKDFLQMERAVNYQAMDQMYKLVAAEFGHKADYDYELVRDDGDDPYLILSISTHGLSLDEVLEKEMRVFEVIARSDVLSSANKYHVISAI